MINIPRILLTGGTGLVGTELVNMLKTSFQHVHVTSRKHMPPEVNVNWIKSDFSTGSAKDLDSVLKKTDVIIHNAASLKLGTTKEEIEEVKNVNINFTKSLLDSAVKNNIKKIIFTSSMSVIEKPLPNVISETSATAPFLYYSESKFIGENIIAEYAGKYDIRYCIMRLSSPLAFNLAAMPENVIKKWITAGITGKPIEIYGSGNRTQDFISVKDISSAFLLAIENEKAQGLFNIASGKPLSMLNLARIISEKFGNDYVFTGTDKNENDRWQISIDKARKELGFNPLFTSEAAIRKLLNTI